jgi:two-component system, NarL family, nitrate/nitrite response regulator NarL
MIRLLIADDHAIFREGLQRVIATQPDLVVVGEADNGYDAVRRACELHPDVLIQDLAIPGLSGLAVVAELSRMQSDVRVILLAAAIDRAETVKALQLGAHGIVLKESASDVLFNAIRTVVAGGYWVGPEAVSEMVHMLSQLSVSRIAPGNNKFGLTPRELQVVGLVVAGYSNKEIARHWTLSEDTVKHHLTNIFDKTGASNRLELALFAIHHQLVLPSAGGERHVPRADDPPQQTRPKTSRST